MHFKQYLQMADQRRRAEPTTHFEFEACKNKTTTCHTCLWVWQSGRPCIMGLVPARPGCSVIHSDLCTPPKVRLCSGSLQPYCGTCLQACNKCIHKEQTDSPGPVTRGAPRAASCEQACLLDDCRVNHTKGVRFGLMCHPP